jgi:hypothetical protein
MLRNFIKTPATLDTLKPKGMVYIWKKVRFLIPILTLQIFIPKTALPVQIQINFSGSNNDVNISGNYEHEIKAVIYDATNTPVTLFDTLFRGYKYFTYNFTAQTNTLSAASNIEVSSIINPLFTV